jgi:hypothetical protein
LAGRKRTVRKYQPNRRQGSNAERPHCGEGEAIRQVLRLPLEVFFCEQRNYDKPDKNMNDLIDNFTDLFPDTRFAILSDQERIALMRDTIINLRRNNAIAWDVVEKQSEAIRKMKLYASSISNMTTDFQDFS